MPKSTIRVGTTEGCFHMIMPNLMRQFKEMYNDYDIRGVFELVHVSATFAQIELI